MKSLRMRGALVLLREVMDPNPLLAGKQPSGYHEVIACGPNVEVVKPGDVVVCEKPGGTSIRFDGQDLVVFREDQMLAVRE